MLKSQDQVVLHFLFSQKITSIIRPGKSWKYGDGGFLALRKKLGEERYATLKGLSDKMRALFEADPEDKTGDARAGREIIHEMENILTNAVKRR